MAVRPIFLPGPFLRRPASLALPDFGVAGGYLAVPGNRTFANEALSTFGGYGGLVATKGEPPYLAISGANYEDVAFGTRALYSGRDKTILVLFWANSIPSSGIDYGVVSLAKNDDVAHNFNGASGAISISTAGTCRIGDYDGSLTYGDCGTVTAGKWYCAVGTVKSGVRIAGALDGRLGVSRSIGTATLTDGSFLRANVVDQGRFQVERFPGRIALVACWNRAFSDAELVKYSANPWLVFRKLARPSFFLPASGGSSATIAGTQSGAGAQTGAITTAIQAAGIQIGLGATSGALSTAITLAGTVTGVGTLAGDILTRIELGGAVLGAGLQALSLATGISVAGIVAGEGAASGGISLAITIGGQQLADSLVTAGIVTAIEIAGQQIGAGAAAGSLGGTAAQIGGAQAGAGATSLALSTAITLTGQQIGDAIMAGSLTTEIRIGAVQNGVGVIVGGISVPVVIAGTVSGTGATTGVLGSAVVIIWHSPFMKVHRLRSSFQIVGQSGFQVRHN